MCAQPRSHVLFFATPWTAARQAPLPMGFSRQEYRSGLSFPSPEDLADPRMEPASPASPALAGRFFITEPPWEATVSQFGTSGQRCHFLFFFLLPLPEHVPGPGGLLNPAPQHLAENLPCVLIQQVTEGPVWPRAGGRGHGTD